MKRSLKKDAAQMDRLMVEMVATDSITPYPKNAKKHTKAQIAEVARSIKEFGFNQPVVVDRENICVVGHGRVLAATELGMKEVPVIRLDKLSPAQVDAYRLADNKLNESPWDMNLVLEELAKLSQNGIDVLLTGFSPDLLLKPDAKDDVLPEHAPSRVKPGEIWKLGRHRIGCGSATDNDFLDALMAGKRANISFTDPPYNIDYTGKTKEALKIKGDKMKQDAFEEFLRNACAAILARTDGGIYICMGASQIGTLKTAFEAVGGHWSDTITWVKNIFTLSGAHYQHQSEQILYGWNAKNKKPYFIAERNGANVWEDLREVETHYDGTATEISFQGFKVRVEGKIQKGEVIRRRQRTDIWRYDRPSASRAHPTMKPVALVTEAIINSSRTDEIVLDTFLGSGSTLIAAEKTGRTCYGTELDPKYCDTIVARWEEYTGAKAEKEKNPIERSKNGKRTNIPTAR